MPQYIDKDALAAEIDRRIQFFTEESGNSNSDIVIALFGLKSFLVTLEVKEVDLVKEYDNEFFKDPVFSKLVNRNAGISIAKHFFELGLKAQKEN